MTFPSFNEMGDLPVDIYQCTLSETLERFGNGTAKRRAVALRLQRIYNLAKATGYVKHFIIFGSFVTNKAEPQDVNVFLLMANDFRVSETTGETQLLFDHLVAQSHFGASIFWLRALAALDGEQSAVEDWQVKRDGTRRGLIEIAEGDSHDSE